MGTAASSSDEARSRERLQGAVAEEYRIGRLIGRGGFAEVFEAEDPRLERTVAIKVIRPDLAPSHELVERFQREAQSMARLRHPHIMEIYTVGEADGVAFFVMPLIRGESLADRLEREGMLPVETATRILTEAAGALDAAHRLGMIHRDIKPDNILLEGEAGRVVIADFGIAKALELDGAALTGTGIFVGTPRYMSPEQAVGDAVDHRSDTYSLGVVAFQMIAGRLPFEAGTTQALIAKHLTEEPPPLWSVRPDCPERLAHAVARCLAKDPGERWDSLAEMVAVLEGDVAAAGGAAAPPDAPDAVVGGDATDEADEAAAGVVLPPREVRLRGFHRRALTAAGLVAAAVLADLALGLGGVSAWLAVIAAFYLAARAARLWREGYEWAELVPPLGRRRAVRSETPVGMPIPEVEQGFGRFGSLVQTCIADRATIMKAYADVPRQEQARFPRLRETTEGLLHRAKHLARKVVTLEDRVAEASRRIPGERAGLGGDDELATAALSRHSARLEELTGARDEAAAELRLCVAQLEELRDAITERMRHDPSAGMDELERAVTRAATYLGERATP